MIETIFNLLLGATLGRVLPFFTRNHIKRWRFKQLFRKYLVKKQVDKLIPLIEDLKGSTKKLHDMGLTITSGVFNCIDLLSDFFIVGISKPNFTYSVKYRQNTAEIKPNLYRSDRKGNEKTFEDFINSLK